MKDTATVKLFDSTTVIQKGNEHIILIQDLKKENVKDWYEATWITSFLIPILVAVIVAVILNWLNRNKTNLENDKIKAETSKLRKSFQPIVIGTLQSIQDKIMPSKINALKELVQIKNDFKYHEQQYHEGEPITIDYDEFIKVIFYNFYEEKYNAYCRFHDKYSYLFPNNVFEIFIRLKTQLSNLNETKKSFDSVGDQDTEPGKKDKESIEQIIKSFDEAILAIRSDCHLDTSFIHEFIEQNK